MLALFRVPLIGIYFLLINVVILAICILRPFHRNNVYIAGRLYSSVSRLLGVKLEFRIPEEVKSGGPFVFIGNHQNSYDIFTVCGATLPGTVSVGKKSLKWIPLFGQVYWLSGNILIDRKNTNRARSTLSQTIDKIKQRRLSVWLFPEGTRSYGRGLLPFKTGAFRIAKETNEPISMICASELHNKIKLNRWNNGVLIVELTPPQLMDESRSVKQWTEYFHQKMSENIARLNQEVEQIEQSR